MDIEKLNEFILIKEEFEEVEWQSHQSLDSENRRLLHLIEVLKNPTDVFQLIFALLSLNVSIEKIYQIICG